MKLVSRLIKTCWYYLMHTYVGLGISIFFKEVRVSGKNTFPKNGAVIFVANHQNAFLDALLLVTKIKAPLHFLVRADVFNNPFARWILGTLNMMPIYRIRDGWKSLNKNEAIFQHCYKILGSKGSILIFPEGNHHIQRRLRPLSKGFTRLAFGTHELHPNLPIYIIPVGINYSNHAYFRERSHLVFGEPLLANPYLEASTPHLLKEAVREALKPLVLHIDNPEKYELIEQELSKDPSILLDPPRANREIKRLSEMELTPIAAAKQNKSWKKVLGSILWLPWLPPLLLWKWLESKIADEAFWASIKFALGIFLFAPYTLALSYLLTVALESPVWHTLAFLPAFVLLFIFGGELHRQVRGFSGASC